MGTTYKCCNQRNFKGRIVLVANTCYLFREQIQDRKTKDLRPIVKKPEKKILVKKRKWNIVSYFQKMVLKIVSDRCLWMCSLQRWCVKEYICTWVCEKCAWKKWNKTNIYILKKIKKACTSKMIFDWFLIVFQTWLVATLCARQKGRSVSVRAPKRCDMIVSAVNSIMAMHHTTTTCQQRPGSLSIFDLPIPLAVERHCAHGSAMIFRFSWNLSFTEKNPLKAGPGFPQLWFCKRWG